KRSAEYQQQQAIEAKRQADALERQNMRIPYPYLQYQFPPYYPAYPLMPVPQSYPAYPPVAPHQHTIIKERTIIAPPQSKPIEIKPGEPRFANPPPKKFIYQFKEAP
ncbi:MAG: hypothetical protein ACXWEV_07760, partial [Methylobacter sp.]